MLIMNYEWDEDKNKSKSYENILGYLSKPVTVDDLISIASTV